VTASVTELGHEADPPLSQPTAPLLRVEGLSVAFSTAQGRIEAVRDISFAINAGEVLALVGESGSGKSVTARALVGLAGQRAEVQASAMTMVGHDGRIVDLQRLAPRGWRAVRGREIGFVLQDALVSLDPLRTVGREIAEPLLAHDLLPKSEVAAEVKSLLFRAGIPDPDVRAAQYPHELSGGLRQRALIASALAARPRLLIADEPTTALDVTVQQQVLAVFADLARAGHGVLLITHDLAAAAQVAHRIAVMQHGRIVETGPAQQILTAPGHAYARRLRAAVPGAATRGRRLAGTGTGEALLRQTVARDRPPLLEVDDVSVRFKRPDGSVLDALDRVSLLVRPGETLGIVGESGSGKTTLAKVALALQRPDQGEVRFDGVPWSGLAESARRPLRRRLQTIVQDPFSSFDPRYSVERILEQPLRLDRDIDRAARRRRIAALIDLVSLPAELLARRPGTLSGGQRQRVSIAQALAAEPKLLVCDEPVSALDVTTQAQVLDLLASLQAKLDLAMLFISHDLGVIRHVSHRIAVMEAGRVVETGTVDDVFDRPQHPYTRRLLGAIPRLPDHAR
jgi:peptide/nickel transport system ATP-binding protein